MCLEFFFLIQQENERKTETQGLKPHARDEEERKRERKEKEERERTFSFFFSFSLYSSFLNGGSDSVVKVSQ